MSTALSIAPQACEPDLNPWRLHSSLNVHQAAPLILGVDPSKIDRAGDKRPPTLDDTVNALQKAVLDGDLTAMIRYSARSSAGDEALGPEDVFAKTVVFVSDAPDFGPDFRDEHICSGAQTFVVCKTPDWDLTTIPVWSIRRWLIKRRFNAPFFFPPGEKLPQFEQFPRDEGHECLSRDHPRYSAKLAAAIRTWEIITSKGNKTVKQAIEKYLEANAIALGLVLRDGRINKQAIQDVAKIVNWETEGGAPRTLG